MNNVNDAFNLINAIRSASQMEPLTYSIPLSRAAQNHANYLANNIDKYSKGIDLHAEKSTRPYFSGVNASARSAKAAYPYKHVRENISAGSRNIADSISVLMSGIYHRFTFLDFLIDTVGNGVAADKTGFKSYVYNMGRKDMENTCNDRPLQAVPSNPVDCLGTAVNTDYIESACNSLPQAALFETSFSSRCENGRLLKSSYMEAICNNPPQDILFEGEGTYYEICQPRIRINASWFNELCNANNSPALHSGENRYYEICENKTRVYASWFKNYCDSASASDQVLDSSYYLNLCHSDFKVSSLFSKEQDARQYEKNPDFVIWPPLNANEVTPVFFDETPDPLPDLDVSGYPLSVQFNPGKVKTAKVSAFKLEKKNEDGTWTHIKAIRKLDHINDPQKIFSKLQFAWFPLQRLDWNSSYRASVNAQVDGERQKIYWSFSTQSITTQLITVKPEQNKVLVPKNKWFSLYLVPSKAVSLPIQKTNLKWKRPAKVKSNIIDQNTIKVKIESTVCQPVMLEMAQGRKLILNTCKPS